RHTAVFKNPRGGGEIKRRRRRGEWSVVWYKEDQESARQRAERRHDEDNAPRGRGDCPPHEMRTRRAEGEGADENADRESSSFFEPSRRDLHPRRVHAGECGTRE